MKILQISASYKPAFVYGGPIQSVACLCESLVQWDYEVDVYTTTANGKFDLELETGKVQKVEGVNVIYFKRWTKDHSQFSPALLWNVFWHCRKYDAVHIQSWWNMVAVLSTWVCMIRSVKPIISLRGTMSAHTFEHRHAKEKNLLHWMIGKRLLRKSVLHVTSLKEEMEVKKFVPGACVKLIPNLLELTYAESGKSLPPDGSPVQLIFLGRIDPVKNIELLLETYALLPEQNKFSLKLIGTGKPEYIKQLKDKFSDLPGVIWVGELSGEEKYKTLREADVLLLLSHTENFGNVVIEALSQGTPVIVSRNVGVSAFVERHQLGWVIEPDRMSLLDVLLKIAEDRKLTTAISQYTQRIVKKVFDTNSLLMEYKSMYIGIKKGAWNLIN